MSSKDCILVVDDDESVLRSLSLVLKKKGFEVVQAGTGKEALDKVRERQVDLTVLDIKLPDIQGLDLIDPLLKTNPDMAIVMVTGFASVETAVQSLTRGASAYITKPVNLDEFLVTIKNTFEHQHLVTKVRLAEEEIRESNEQLVAADMELRRQYGDLFEKESRIRQAEERYRSVVEDQTELICRFRPDGTLTFVNDAYCRYFGIKRNESIGKRHSINIPPDEAARVKKHLEALTRDNPGAEIEHRIIMPAGEVRWQRWNDRAIFDESGEIAEYQSVGRDTTGQKRAQEELRAAYEQITASEEELRQQYDEIRKKTGALQVSEEWFRNLIDTTSDWIWEVDQTGKYTFASPKIRDLLGYEPEEIIGKTPFDLMPPKEAEKVAGIFIAYLTSQKPFVGLENTNLHKDGRHVVLETSGVPFFNDRHALLGYRGIDRDITDRRRAQEELRAAYEQVAASEEELRQQYSELANKDEAIRQLNRDLEKRVEERTGELRQANEELKNAGEELRDQIEEIAKRDRQLAQSEERFRISAQCVSDVIWDWDITTRRLDWYGRIDEILGYAPGEFPRNIEAWENIIHPDDRVRVLSELDRHVTTGAPYAAEYRVIRKDGEIRYWIDKGTAMRDERGTAYRMVGSCSDITDRKMAEVVLRASETRYRRLFESAHDGILILDAGTGQIVEVNPFLIDLLGFSREQFLGKKIWEIGLFKDIAANKDNFEELQRKESIRYEDLPLQTADGRNIAVEFVSNVYMVNDKKVIQCQIRDITDRKLAEEAKIASETRYRRLFEAAQDGILILDAGTGQIVEVNPFLITMLGFSREQFLGKKLWEVGLFKDIAANKDNFEELQRKESIRYENLPLETADGRNIAVEFVSNLYMVNNKKVIQCNIRDITERKKIEVALNATEIRYRRLFEAAQDGILILDAGTGQIVEVNPFLINLLGFSHEQFLGKKIWDIGIFKDIVANKDNFKELQSKDYIRYEDLPLETSDGRHIGVEFVSNVYTADTKKVIQCNIRDITERKKMADLINASLAEKETLLKEVHHRVKNNLQIIASLLNLQIRKIDDPTTIETLKDCQSRVRSMALVHEHLYKGKDFSHVDLGNYIRALGTVLFNSSEAGNRGVRLDLDIHDIYVDTNTAIPLGLISNELITNSLKYAFKEKKDGRLSITATEDPVALTFVVADNGAGMAPGITLENQTSLGLQLVSTLTDQLNGTATIDRTGGTKFTFTFPKPAEQKLPGGAVK